MWRRLDHPPLDGVTINFLKKVENIIETLAPGYFMCISWVVVCTIVITEKMKSQNYDRFERNGSLDPSNDRPC